MSSMPSLTPSPSTSVESTNAAVVDSRPRKAAVVLGAVLAVSGLSLAVSGAFSPADASAQDADFTQALRAGHGSEIKEPPAIKQGLFGDCKPDGSKNGDNFDPGIQYRCEGRRYDPPSVYMGTAGKNMPGPRDANYDLAIIGGGIQAAYLVQSLRNRLGKDAEELNIGIFEQNTHFGGRLMSAYSGGDLSLGVQSGVATTKMVPPEYGGMRVDPYNHPLIWDAMMQVATQHGKTCKRSGVELPLLQESMANEQHAQIYKQWIGRGGPTSLGTSGEGCTDPDTGYMQRMYTSHMRYYTGGSKEDYGDYLLSGRVGAGDTSAVQNNCLSLIDLGGAYVKKNATAAKLSSGSMKYSTLIDDACTNCATVPGKTNAGAGNEADNLDYCSLCKLFPRPGLNLVSCIGYDDLPSVSAAVANGEGGAITGRGATNCNANLGPTDGVVGGINGCSRLYMVQSGLTKLAQDMLYAQNAKPNVPVTFQKKLTELELEGADAQALATAQYQKAKGSVAVDYNSVPAQLDSEMPVKLTFSDNSVARAKAVYLTTLPDDLVKIKGFEAYAEGNKNDKINFGANKFFINWADGMPSELLESFKSPDTDGEVTKGQAGVIRIVMDGDRKTTTDGWVTRQVWYWDPETILVYSTATEIATDPSNILQKCIQDEGMAFTTNKVVGELSMAFFGKSPDGTPTKTFPKPTWGRVKGWPSGSLAYYESFIPVTGLYYSQHMARPFGPNVPVWFGSSEASGTGGNGWIEGSMEFVYLALPVISQFLASGGTILGPTPEGF